MTKAVESSIQTTAAFLKQQLPERFQSVSLGIICGSGLGGLVDTIDPSTKIEFAYKDIPGFAVSTGMSSAWEDSVRVCEHNFLISSFLP